MSQNIPWLVQALVCVICKVVLSMAASAEAARKALMCNHCKGNAWHALKQYATGNASVNHLNPVKVAKGYMFSEEVVNLFATNMGHLVDFQAFQKWWSTNTVGQELDPAYPSIKAFIDRVTGSYNKIALDRHSQEIAAGSKIVVTADQVQDLATDMEAHDPNKSTAKRDCKALAAERLTATIKRMKLRMVASDPAVEGLAAEIEANPNVSVDRLAASFMKKVLDSLTDEQRAAAGARPAKSVPKKGKNAKDSEADAPHTADVVVHESPAKPETEDVTTVECDKKEGGGGGEA